MTAEPLLLPLRPVVLVAGSLAGAVAMIAWRLRETSRPVTMRRIVAPPLGMTTGLAMFALPAARAPWTWGVSAFAAGALLFAIPLARGSRLVRSGEAILLERSRAFLWILLGLMTVRFALRAWVEQYLTPLQTGGLFFLLAWGMVLRWRVGMARDYRRLLAHGDRPPSGPRGAPPVRPAGLA
jgi:membrane protein CcdC involved in cytochrome C biogenesis